jgi:hypothetical protein
VGPTTPARQRRRAITPHRFRLIPVRSPLLRESRLLSLPHPTEMFQFRQFPPQALCVQTWVTGHDPCRVSPFGHPRIYALLAAPRGFSQPHASFFGSWRLGIHRGPLLTWPRCSRSLCGSQGARQKRGPSPDLFSPRGLAPSGPNSVPRRHLPSARGSRGPQTALGRHLRKGQRSTWSFRVSPGERAPPRTQDEPALPMLLRKEVIQPHLPVRLPCYDFTPIAGPTFGSSLPEGLGH